MEIMLIMTTLSEQGRGREWLESHSPLCAAANWISLS